MSSREFSEWLAFYEVEPFGEARDDLRAGIVAATVANASRRKGRKALKPEDFVPRFRSPALDGGEQSWEEQLRTVEMLNAALGGEDLRGGEGGHSLRSGPPLQDGQGG